MGSEQSYTDEDRAVLDIIRMATFDPGRFVTRESKASEYGGTDYEPLHAWQARAVLAALTRHEVV